VLPKALHGGVESGVERFPPTRPKVSTVAEQLELSRARRGSASVVHTELGLSKFVLSLLCASVDVVNPVKVTGVVDYGRRFRRLPSVNARAAWVLLAKCRRTIPLVSTQRVRVELE
jgi:hypothetical protein